MIRLVPAIVAWAIAVVLGGTATSTPARADTQRPSANGQLIAFERRNGMGVADIYVVRRDGTGLRQPTRDREARFVYAFASLGTRVVVA